MNMCNNLAHTSTHHACAKDGDLKRPYSQILVEIFGRIGGWFVFGIGFGGDVVSGNQITTVCLDSIYHPQIEDEFITTPGVLTSIFMVARTSLMCELVLATINFVLAPLEVGPEFTFN
jgi:hypothetical protein